MEFEDLNSSKKQESSSDIFKRVEPARKRQLNRFHPLKNGVEWNSQMSHRMLRKFCVLGNKEIALLKQAMETFSFSARAHDKILKVARTIADLAESEQIRVEHMAEAIQYRNLDRNLR